MADNATLFKRTLSLIPPSIFYKLEKKYETGRSSRKFGFSQQFIFLAFLQLASFVSMRSTLENLKAITKKLYHLGFKIVALSTISEANNHRPVGFFQDLFAYMYDRCSSINPKHKFRFKSKLYSMDATIIRLCNSLFPWAAYRRNTSGIKMNTVIDHDGYIPTFISIDNAKVNEKKMTDIVNKLPKKSIITFDRGYNNYKWFKELTEKSLFFVTRMIKSASYRTIKEMKVNKKLNIVFDNIIEVKTDGGKLRLRHIKYYDKDNDKYYEYITNHLDLSARTIADIYKERWQIELFFKEIKQHLKIKKFVGNSENAVLIQIYTALTVYLILAFHKFMSKSSLSIGKILIFFNQNLYEKIYLEEWLNPPEQKITENKISQHSLI